VFSPFFAAVAADYFMAQGMATDAAEAQAQSTWAYMIAIVGVLIGVSAPFLGAFADVSGRRRQWVFLFSVMTFFGAFGLWFMDPAGSNLWWMLATFGVGFVGVEFALIFINAQLPSMCSKEEIGRISGAGFAFGYLGGVIALFIVLLFFVEQDDGKTLIGMRPALGLDADAREGTRFAGPLTAIWFAVFMVPYFLWVHEPPRTNARGSARQALRMVATSLSKLRHRRSLAAFLGGSMLYRDALNGVYTFGGIYATLVLKWELTFVGIFGIVAVISSAIFSYLGGLADSRVGPKPVIRVSVWVLIGICVTTISMSRTQFFGVPLAADTIVPDVVFFGCGVLLGGFGGILQSASRSMMVRHCDPKAPTESFGLYGLTGRATAFLAPMLIGLVTMWTGSVRLGISPVVVLFVLGLVLLRWVNSAGEQGSQSEYT
jgi:UMF1 family MFS transporter